MWRVRESVEDDLLRNLGSLRTIGMAAHAVDNHEQRRVLADRYSDAVLVLLAPAQEADVGVVDPQEDSMYLLDLVALYITPQQTSVAFGYIRPATPGPVLAATNTHHPRIAA
jgi:hypothetical protein